MDRRVQAPALRHTNSPDAVHRGTLAPSAARVLLAQRQNVRYHFQGWHCHGNAQKRTPLTHF